MAGMADDDTPAQERPIGYWVKQLDRLLDERLDATLATDGLTRRHWQVLNVLHGGAATSAEVDEALQPFLTDDRPTAAPLLDDLRRSGWVTGAGGGPYRLAPGRAGDFAALRERVGADRCAVAAGVSPGEYRTTVATLARMAANLAGDR